MMVSRPTRIYNANSHSFGDIVKRHRKHKHRCALKTAFCTLRLGGVHVKMRYHSVQYQKKEYAKKKTHRRRNKPQSTHFR